MPLAFPYGSSSLLSYIVEPAARSLALGCAAALALAAMRVKDVSVKLLVWRGVLVAALAMPLLEFFTPAVRVPMPLPSFETRGSVRTDEPARAMAVRRTPPIPMGAPEDVRPSLRMPEPSKMTVDVQPAPTRYEFPIVWPAVFLTVYLTFAIFFLGRLFVGMRWGKRLERAAGPIEDPFALRAVAICTNAASLREAPRIAESEMVSVPVTLGVRNPVILLPTDWREWDEVELESVLAHETSHVARHDGLIQRLALVHRAIFWFSPLAWWLDRHLADLAEQASDEAALAGGADRTGYAEMLLGFFASLDASRERVWWQGVSMATAGEAERRVDRILAWRGVMSNKLRKSLVIGLVAVAAPVVVLTASVHPSVYNFQAPANPEPPQGPPPPATPRPSANPETRPGPAPQAPSVAPIAPIVPITPPAAIAPMAPIAAQSQEQTAPPAKPAKSDDDDNTIVASGGPRTGIYGGITGGVDDDWGPRFVIVTKNSNSVTMSGTEEDARHARSLHNKIPGDFIWFERDEKSYIIRDQATVDRAKKFWEPEEELGKKQEELGKQQEALGKQQEALGEKMEEVRVKIPDMSAELQAVAAKMKELSANGGTQEEIGELQSQIGELQSRVGEIQSDAGRQQSEIGRQQSELGRKQGELGRQQGELGRQQGEVAKRATRQMRELLDDAIAHGLAQLE
jgi:beta-lactamase regulating signal transducer with metallopeptidase domain